VTGDHPDKTKPGGKDKNILGEMAVAPPSKFSYVLQRPGQGKPRHDKMKAGQVG
jgi:hypothetical protein